VFWREIVRLGRRPGYELSPAMRLALTDGCGNGAFAEAPAMLAYGLELMAQDFERGGHPEVAEQVRLASWRRNPTLAELSLADVELAAARSSARDAFAVIDPAIDGLEGAGRTAALARLLQVAHEIVRIDGAAARDVYERIAERAGSDGPFGCIVHFLLDHGAAFPGAAPDSAHRQQLLLGHLQLVAQGRDDGAFVASTADRLLATQGAEAVLTDVEALLARHPTALPLWRARALALARLQQAGPGLQDLRMALAHGRFPAEVRAFVLLGAIERVLARGDAALLDALPPELQQDAEAQFARGLLLLRLGRADEALPLLERASPRADGLHLYATALALLQSSAADGLARAHALFTALARDYASSSFARNAGSFARQSEPR
jgi:tetratricopeptide (TPR) repeat protein